MTVSRSKTSPKPKANKLFGRSAAILKLLGLSTIAITLLNYVMLLVPPSLTEPQWWLSLTTQVIEQGILPLFGLGIFFAGIAIETLSNISEKQGGWIVKTETWSYRLAFALGLVFVLLGPIHAVTTIVNNQVSVAALEERLAAQDEQVKFQLERQRELYTALLDGEASLEDLVGDEPLSESQMVVLDKIKGDPDALDRQLEAAQIALREEMQERASGARSRSKLAVWKSILRLGLTSWMLAGCYLNVAWIGLRGDKKPKVKIKRQKPASKKQEQPGDFL
ncbi:MAG: HpsJ family protein [Geitlerinemataceae cyanobacterium]